MMNKLSFHLALVAATLSTACSHQQMYDAIQVNQKNECLKLPNEAYERCMEAVARSYDEYQAQRQQAMGSNRQ
jgi:hypothetical protein